MRAAAVTLIGLLEVVAGCGSEPPAAAPVAEASSTVAPSTAATTVMTVPAARHPDHDGLAALLPSAAELGWLPPGVTESADSDLTSVLVLPECTGPFTTVPANSGCDDLLVVRTHQPVSQTVDAFCTVANVVASIRLYPNGLLATVVEDGAPAPTPPTSEQAASTVAVVSARLRAAG